jgi:uncharacterized protein (DUF488 family)
MTVLYTVGHSNRTLADFMGMLREAGIAFVADVRAYPFSRRHPQFDRPRLEHDLGMVGIDYRWVGEALGGRRKARPGSAHISLSESFRGYADHMETAAFEAAVGELVVLGDGARLAFMCAERLPEDCHRGLIADWLATRGVGVTHLLHPGIAREHLLDLRVRMDGRRLVYDLGSQRRML